MEKLLDGTVDPEHMLKLAGKLTEGKGLTVIVYRKGFPAHPFRNGVTRMVAVTGDVPLFVAVNPGRFPLPPAPRPIDVFEFVQVYVVPGILLLNAEAITVPPEHTATFEGTTALGSGFTVMV